MIFLSSKVMQRHYRATQFSDTIKICWNDSSSPSVFHNYWLRDHCQCSACVHPSNKQKLHSSGDVKVSAKPAIEIAGKNLKIKWQKGSLRTDLEKTHESVFDLDWLKRHSYSPKPTSNLDNSFNSQKLVKLWDKDVYEKEKYEVDYNDITSNNPAGLSKTLDMIKKFGLVFLKNVPTEGRKLNPDSETETISVEEVAKIFGPIRETFYGKSWDVKIVPEAKNIAYTNLDLGLHMDLLYFEAPPGLQYLHSLKNSVKGGTSIFLDSFKAVEYLKQISPESYEILKSEYITFHYENDNHNYHYQKKIIDTSNPNEYLQVNYSPPFQGPIIFENNNKIEKFYKSLFEFEQILKMPGMIFKYRLNPGDLVIFHNRRVFHGRTSFDAVGGERHFKGTYTDWDDFKDLERRSNFEEQE